jgi:hypothetical protein
MGIRVNHYADPALLGAVAYQGGRDQAWAAGIERQNNRDLQLQMQQQAHEQQFAMFDAQSAARKSQLDWQADIDRQNRLDAIEQQKSLEEWKYTTNQRREIDKINEGLTMAKAKVASGEWTREQGAEAIRQLEAKRMGIEPVRAPRQESPYPEGQRDGDVWATPDGATVTRDPGGKVRKLYDPPTQVNSRDMFNLIKEARETLTTEEVDSEGNVRLVRPDPEDVMAYVKENLAIFRAVNGVEQPEQGAAMEQPMAEPAQLQAHQMPAIPMPEQIAPLEADIDAQVQQARREKLVVAAKRIPQLKKRLEKAKAAKNAQLAMKILEEIDSLTKDPLEEAGEEGPASMDPRYAEAFTGGGR